MIFKGGGPDGFMLDQTVLLTTPSRACPQARSAPRRRPGSMAIGLFFAFWSWVGFETTAVYGEESRNPKKIIPRATLIAVIGLGLFYTFISAMVLAGNGAKTSVETSISASPLDLFFGLVKPTSAACCSTSTRSCSSSDRSPAHSHSTTRRRATSSRSVAKSFLRSAFHGGRRPPEAWFAVHRVGHPERDHPETGAAVRDFTAVQVPDANGIPVDTPSLVPYTNIYGLLALIGTAAILFVQAICSVAVIWYFWVRKTHPGNVITTLIAR